MGVQQYLVKILDWDHEGIHKDLNKIADSMVEFWEEILSSSLPYNMISDLQERHQTKPKKLR